MYILIIARGIPSDRYPQWGCFERDQAEAIASLGHKVVVVSVDSRFLWHYRKIGITKTSRNNVVSYNGFWIPGAIIGLLGETFKLFIKQKQLQRIYKRVVAEYGKPDIICGHFSFITSIAVNIAIKNKIPLVGIEHNAIFNEENLSKRIFWISDYTYKHTQQIISVSRNLQERIKYHLGKDSIIVNNTFGDDFLDVPCAKPYKNLIKFVATGNLIYRKGYDLLIRAFKELDLPKELWELNIIGDGEEEQNLSLQIKNANLQDNIFLLGRKNKSEIVDLLTQSNFFMMPSRNENFSVAILEALACGLPIIASDCGGVRDCINSSNGIIFPVDNVEELKNAILQIYENKLFFDNKSIAEQCKNQFGPKVIARQLTDVFEKVVEEYKQKQLK